MQGLKYYFSGENSLNSTVWIKTLFFRLEKGPSFGTEIINTNKEIEIIKILPLKTNFFHRAISF